jgi:hypothetical protein
MYFLERACQAQVMALAGGAPVLDPPPGSAERTAIEAETGLGMIVQKLAWPALLRMLDRADASFRD